MNVHIKSMMRCMKFQNHKKLSSKMEEGTESVTKTANGRIDKKNENSPKCQEYIVLNNHSTPIRQKHSSDNAEDTSNLDYSPNPILLPCTQDGGNEVAWDWQSTQNKTPTSKSSKHIVQPETPKGTRPFQRKRNSDSPLLCKPFKRKSIKMENIEHMGQFAAELQALSEKVRIIKQNDQNDLEDCIKKEPAIVNTSNDEEVRSSIVDNKENHAAETNTVSKRNLSYDDLFDNSVDDFTMARCTQEVEEKFNLTAAKENSTVYSQVNIKKENLSPTNNITTQQMSAVQPKKNSVAALTKKTLSHENVNGDSILKIDNDSTLKTYSKLPLRKDANSSVLVSSWKDKDLHKLCLNNMVHCDIEKSYDDKKSSKDNITELFEFPNDSFDDCLATCCEDDKLLSMSAESSSFLVPKFESTYKNLTHAPLKGKLFSCNSTASKAKVETSTTGCLDNRKFFKFKSLSDQYIGQNSANYKSTTHVTLPSYLAKSALHLNSTSNNSTVSHRTSVTRTSINTGSSVPTNSHRKIENSAISLISSADRTAKSDVNRCAVKEGGNRFVKYNSTGNMKSDTKESAKIVSMSAQCTAEEIERKRQQAKMRLEARQKVYALNIKNNINRVRRHIYQLRHRM